MKPLDPTGVKRLHREWRHKTDRRVALILDLRDVLRDNGVPLRPEQASGCAPCGMASPAHRAASVTGDTGAADRAGPAQSAGPAVEGAGRPE